MLKDRKIDAAMQPYPFSYEAEEAGPRNLGPLSALIPDCIFTGTVVDETWARANRRMVVGYLRALQRGTPHMIAHLQEAAELAAPAIGTTVAYARRGIDDSICLGVLKADLRMGAASLRRVFGTVKAAGGVPADAVFDATRFSDPSYLRDVVP